MIASFHETESGSSQPTIGSVETCSNGSNGKKPSKEQLKNIKDQNQDLLDEGEESVLDLPSVD